MKAVLYKKGGRDNALFTEVPDPVCGPEDVLIRVYASAICKPADFAHDGGYSVFGRYPLIPGHEYSGIVEATGEKVIRVRKGDRVTTDANKPCGNCYFCRRGEVQFCDKNEAYGQTMNGGFAQLVAVDESLVHIVPDSVSMKQAAMSELVACAFNCMERCNFKYGADVLILGCGASGTIIAQMTASAQVSSVTVMDSVSSKLKNIEKIGAETVLLDRENRQGYWSALRERFPHGLDYIIDTTADSELITESLGLLKKGGTFVNYAFQNNVRESKKVEIDTKMFATRQLSYIGSTFSHYRIDQALRAMETGQVDPCMAVTAVLPLEKFFEGMDMMRNDEETVKVIFEPNGPSDSV